MKKKYKVLTKDLKSPFKYFQYELSKEYVCSDFDESDKECSRGFYATDIEGILYSLKYPRRVFEVEVSGKERIFNPFKQRFEKQTIIREIPDDELKRLVKEENDKLRDAIIKRTSELGMLTNEKLPRSELERIIKELGFADLEIYSTTSWTVIKAILSLYLSGTNSISKGINPLIFSPLLQLKTGLRPSESRTKNPSFSMLFPVFIVGGRVPGYTGIFSEMV